jgi:hypothetical protein
VCCDFDLGNADSGNSLIAEFLSFFILAGCAALKQWPSARIILKPASEDLIGAVAALFRKA